ncbi:hypothetical protein ACH5RR_037644 [Cinchona calisaya]|uniref:Uncharacterized protein n=1 Tax=Cinchona calisaya TaxID=153742 RepID=A0ABD2Y842_9GENT
MEVIHSRKTSSGDKFSFPIIIPSSIQDNQEFQFGNSVTLPGSPNSPADHLFSNGKLLPHSFPSQPTNYNIVSFSRSTSRTSSVCSKDSLISSRSNSTNSSRSSSCNSARTSTSDKAKFVGKNTAEKDNYLYYKATKKQPVLLTPQYYTSASQRWQFIAPAPALKHQVSRARKAEICIRDQECNSKKQRKDWTVARRTCFGLEFFRAFVSACKECHAMKPSSRKCLDNK